jgi:acetyltransferase
MERRRNLDVFFKPQSVAVIGATEAPGTGRMLLRNLISTPFGGPVFPVNPRRAHVLGVKAYKSVLDVPEPIDLTVIVTPAQTVPGIIDQCAQIGVKGAIVISAGFKETGEQGVELERQIMEKARGMRVVGPNCLGIMCPLSGLNATFANAMARPGSVGFISQSGALCAAILDWSLHELVGFSAFVSIGSMLDVGWGDLIQYLGDDPQTHSIVIYMESVGQARAFLSAAREVALNKPIIVIKPGRTEAGKRAAATHTGSLTGSDEVLSSPDRPRRASRTGDDAERRGRAGEKASNGKGCGQEVCGDKARRWHPCSPLWPRCAAIKPDGLRFGVGEALRPQCRVARISSKRKGTTGSTTSANPDLKLTDIPKVSCLEVLLAHRERPLPIAPTVTGDILTRDLHI